MRDGVLFTRVFVQLAVAWCLSTFGTFRLCGGNDSAALSARHGFGRHDELNDCEKVEEIEDIWVCWEEADVKLVRDKLIGIGLICSKMVWREFCNF